MNSSFIHSIGPTDAVKHNDTSKNGSGEPAPAKSSPEDPLNETFADILTSELLSVAHKLTRTGVIVPGHNLRNINTNKVKLMLIFLWEMETTADARSFSRYVPGLFSATFNLEMKIY